MHSRSRQFILFILLSIALVLFFILDLIFGSVKIPLSETVKILANHSENSSWSYIILSLRLPRAITAIITGSGLAVAGLILQTMFRNPLAGPYVLGISSGAGLGVAILLMSSAVFSSGTVLLNNWTQVMAAVTGSSLIFFLILAVSGKVRDSASLLIIGIMFGSLTSAVINVLQYFSRPELVQKFVIWTMGSLSASGWEQLKILGPVVLSGNILVLVLIKPLNAWLLGEMNAEISGVNIRQIRILIIIATSLLAGSITAFCGPIAFIGMAVPHLTRFIFSTSNHRILFPGTLLTGSVLLLLCDLISQVPGSSLVFPINAITALFGAPVILWIIIGQKRLKNSF